MGGEGYDKGKCLPYLVIANKGPAEFQSINQSPSPSPVCPFFLPRLPVLFYPRPPTWPLVDTYGGRSQDPSTASNDVERSGAGRRCEVFEGIKPFVWSTGPPNEPVTLFKCKLASRSLLAAPPSHIPYRRVLGTRDRKIPQIGR